MRCPYLCATALLTDLLTCRHPLGALPNWRDRTRRDLLDVVRGATGATGGEIASVTEMIAVVYYNWCGTCR